MISQRFLGAARTALLYNNGRTLARHHLAPQIPAMFQAIRSYADKVVQVPQMAESISEGTLKQFTKAVGDFVEQDEELATIETDKVCNC